MLVQAPGTTTTTTPTDPAVSSGEVFAGCEGDGFLCERVLDWTGSETAADWAAFLFDRPLKVLLIVVVAAVVNRYVRKAIGHLVSRIAGAVQADSRTGQLLVSAEQAARARLRADTLGGVLRSLASVVIWLLAGLLVLSELGVNIGPLIAGAGIAGVALGFGAQSLVKDFLSGFFMLLEDQFGVGDIVDVGDATGVVERVTLRTTVVRDVNGTLWHVPNGEILRVGNKSQLWSRALLDVDVAYGTDLLRAQQVILEAARELWADEGFSGMVLEEPEVLGVENLAPDGVTIRLTGKTVPAAQWPVERALRARVARALDDAGIDIPFPQRTVWLQQGGAVPAETAPQPVL